MKTISTPGSVQLAEINNVGQLKKTVNLSPFNVDANTFFQDPHFDARSNDKIEIGYRDASGWHELVRSNAKLKPNQDYQVLLSVNGMSATLVVDNNELFSYVFDPEIDFTGYSSGLNDGLVGLGALNSKARIDNVAVQVLPPELTLEVVEDFSDGTADALPGDVSGLWSVLGNQFIATPSVGESPAIRTADFQVAAPYHLIVETDLAQ